MGGLGDRNIKTEQVQKLTDIGRDQCAETAFAGSSLTLGTAGKLGTRILHLWSLIQESGMHGSGSGGRQ